MQIVIDYSSKWGNSFLEEPDQKGNRKYIASMQNLKDKKNYKPREISQNTVYGILYRLVGARKTLKDLLESDDSFLREFMNDNTISFTDNKSSITEESISLKNKNKSGDRESFSGLPEDSIFEIKGFYESCKVLFYTKDQLIDYIVNNTKYDVEAPKNLSIIDVYEKISESSKDKNLIIDEINFERINKANNMIFDKNVVVSKSNILFVALNKSIKEFYLSLDESGKLFLKKYLSSSFTFSGVSLTASSFTAKDFIGKFAKKKLVYGNPYVTNFWETNEKTGKKFKVAKKLTKTNGSLVINIECEYDTALKIKELIDNAGVSSFYIGKKGLAFVKKIIV